MHDLQLVKTSDFFVDKWRGTRFNILITYQKLGVFQGDTQNLYSERVRTRILRFMSTKTKNQFLICDGYKSF